MIASKIHLEVNQMKEFFTAVAMIFIIIAIAHFTGWMNIDLSALVDSTLFIDHSYYFGG